MFFFFFGWGIAPESRCRGLYVLLDFTWNACIEIWNMLMLFYFLFRGQLITEFVEKENIPFEGVRRAEILLGRDTRPSGESLLEAAKQVLHCLFPLNNFFFYLGVSLAYFLCTWVVPYTF
jgi:hypothetical protein